MESKELAIWALNLAMADVINAGDLEAATKLSVMINHVVTDCATDLYRGIDREKD